ncbi:lipopolysaccharide heptosyltransferase II [Spiribacter sp. C176]|uniref:lipopolysaccharide heptosyltransferase II n=1 Tax=Spiribacter salilacus TaxID=2664894 RepID=A0A6N7QS76_9GAMM|nr:lipopolysaccharide heptosyltransferase II [Spiribacter salilacus]MRH78253.1 lipopolysaccharide heptosyltransferase II [Spiribacter salilacus]
MNNADLPATLIIGPSWIGDMVMAQSLFHVLKAQAPERPLDVVAPEWSLPILDRMSEVREGIALPIQHGELGLRKRWALGRQLRDRNYGQAIILPRSLKSALIPFFAGIPIRTGYLGEHRYGLLTDIRELNKDRHYKTVDRFRALAGPNAAESAIFYPKLMASVSGGGDQSEANQSGTGTETAPIAALCPGAEYGPAKQWPAEYFANLAIDLIKDGWRIWILGSKKDRHVSNAITEHMKKADFGDATDADRCSDLTGKTSLSEVIDLLGRATVTVSNDSGLMHIAAATGCPVVALYGSSDPNFTPPLTENRRILYRNLACSPCFERECPLHHLDCLRGITPAEVRANIDQLLLSGQPPSDQGR